MALIAPAPSTSGTRSPGLSAGVRAPPLDLPATPDGRKVSLEDYQGAPVVLVFYPADFTPVCTSELSLFNELLPQLGNMGARVLGISVDSLSTHIAFAKELGLQIPLLADFHPKGEASRRYQVYREEDGFSERALFVIDGEGNIFWSHVSPIEISPGADGVLDALERLTGQTLEEQQPVHSQAPGPQPEARS
jgi:peroxiredoxin (alkyl hydroperoxide reductase subunit C)